MTEAALIKVVIGGAIKEDTPGSSIAALLANKLASPVKAWADKRGISDWLVSKSGQTQYLKLKNAHPDAIYPELTGYLLCDLQEHLPDNDGKQCRAVLAVDTIESIRTARQSESDLFEAHQWLKALHQPESGLVVVFAGQDRLNWDRQAASVWVNPNYLKQLLIGGLSENDACLFLRRCDMHDVVLQRAILRVCEDTETRHDTATTVETGYHAFSLGLCADTCWNAA